MSVENNGELRFWAIGVALTSIRKKGKLETMDEIATEHPGYLVYCLPLKSWFLRFEYQAAQDVFNIRMSYASAY